MVKENKKLGEAIIINSTGNLFIPIKVKIFYHFPLK